MDRPLDNPRWERYCQERAAGRTQRQAMLAAFPDRARWKPDSVDRAAKRLEAGKAPIKPRIESLKRRMAAKSVATRADILSGLSQAFGKARRTVDGWAGDDLPPVASRTMANAASILLDAIPADATGDGDAPFVADYGLLLAPPHLAMHRAAALDAGIEAWMPGGRMSGKSSAISLEVAGGMMSHPDRSALVFLKVGRYIREGVYEQMLWALDKLGVADEWDCTVSPPRMVRRDTGQAIVFRGCDKAGKTKAIKAPAGTYFAYQWFEELDQFSGMAEVRSLQQSLTRGPGDAPFFRFYSFNPPRSKASWTLAEETRRLAAGMPVWRSTYLDMPPEWVPDAARADAEALRLADEASWRHEYMGEAVGFGAEVFPRAVVREPAEDEVRGIDLHVYGVDWGFAADPFVWLHAGYCRATRTLYVLDELSGHGMTNAESGREVLGRMSRARYERGYEPADPRLADRAARDAPHLLWAAEPFAEVWCDSAEPKSVEDFRQLGIRAVGAPKQGAHSIRSGVRWLQQRAAIVVDPSCELAARELTAYQYELTADGEVTGRLPDRDNHAIDALRYACATLVADRSAI